MKIAAILLILCVYYIVSTEQAAVPAMPGVHTYPRSWKDVQGKVQQGSMKDLKMNAETYPRDKVVIQDDITIPPELYQCANKDCNFGM